MQRVCLVLACLACGGQAAGYSVDSEGSNSPPTEEPPAFREPHPSGSGGSGSAAFASPRGNNSGSNLGVTSGAADAGESARGSAAGAAAGATGALPPAPPRSLPPACDSLRHLDPDDIYLMGTVAEGSCGRDALAHWSNPNVGLTGFGCYNYPAAAIIRPIDHALLISDTVAGVTVFHEDACVTREEGWFGSSSNPLANDGQVAFPCTMPSASHDNRMLLAPSGDTAFWCGAGWFSSAGQLLYLGSSDVRAYDGQRLLTGIGVFDIATQKLQQLVGLPTGTVLTTRVASDGFWLALQGEAVDGDAADTALWHVGHDGHAQLLAEYPAPPARALIQSSSRLTADGALFQLATDAESEVLSDLIVRRTLEGGADIVYDEADHPLVRIHISGLVTGP